MYRNRLLRAGLVALSLAAGSGLSCAESLKVGYLPVTGHARFFG